MVEAERCAGISSATETQSARCAGIGNPIGSIENVTGAARTLVLTFLLGGLLIGLRGDDDGSPAATPTEGASASEDRNEQPNQK